ncbi:DNA/RNA helicase domain-containing protein [Streptomyces amakusaensis]|uniref:DNA/RNA helicase domain-containing protein n=1 Tax=Streptomyces amakusaensis TaxID=67271 RepID=A0ABW0AD79_9ACTN
MSARVLRERTANTALVERLTEQFRSQLRHGPSDRERLAWRNSLPALAEVLCAAGLDEVEVLIEHQMPLSSLRADVVLAGSHPETGRPSYVVVELKQWSEANLVPDTEDLCRVPRMGNRPALHPVAQVRRYRDYLADFTALLNDGQNYVAGVAYLHNAHDSDVSELLGLADGKAHLFTKTTQGEFIRHLRTRLSPLDGALEADALLESALVPGRQLMRAAADEILHGGKFLLMDEQQVAASLVKRAVAISRRSDRKEVIVVSGGPGSGKSLIALHLMSHLGRNQRHVVHATGSKSFTTTLRHVVGEKNKRIANLFRYFLDFRAVGRNELDVLICDEAHRIRQRPENQRTAGGHRSGRSQVEELIDAARVPVFLLDEHQVVRPGEMGSVKAIDAAAEARGCVVRHVDLNEQFRCGGSRAYEHWVRRLLGLEPGGPVAWEPDPNFELLVADTPQQLETRLRSEQAAGYTARMTAGFCWRWSDPRKDGTLVDDVVIGDWRRPWNVKGEHAVHGAPPSSLWATESAGIDQIGCIYTAQGFEYAWNGTIFGPDLVWRGDGWRTVRAGCKDGSLLGAAPDDFARLTRNRYKVLLTRGLTGTVLFSTDAETQDMLRALVAGRAA